MSNGIYGNCRCTTDGKEKISKNFKEDLLEKAFIESFNVLKLDNHEIALEFLNTVEESIDSAKVNQEIIELEESLIKEKNKADQLVGMKLDGIISKEVYEKRYRESDSKIKSFDKKIISLKNNKDETQSFKDKMNTFKLMFQENQSLLEFDREIFENMIEKVIIGRTNDETGIKNPYSATFIFKTGLEMEMDTAKKLEGTYIDATNNVCSHHENHTYEYLKYLLEEMPNNHHLEKPDILDDYMPWSDKLPDCCKLQIKTKKHFKS